MSPATAALSDVDAGDDAWAHWLDLKGHGALQCVISCSDVKPVFGFPSSRWVADYSVKPGITPPIPKKRGGFLPATPKLVATSSTPPTPTNLDNPRTSLGLSSKVVATSSSWPASTR